MYKKNDVNLIIKTITALEDIHKVRTKTLQSEFRIELADSVNLQLF